MEVHTSFAEGRRCRAKPQASGRSVCVSRSIFQKKKEREREIAKGKKKKLKKKKKAKHTAWLSNVRFWGVLLVEAGCPLKVSQENSQWSTAWPCLVLGSWAVFQVQKDTLFCRFEANPRSWAALNRPVVSVEMEI